MIALVLLYVLHNQDARRKFAISSAAFIADVAIYFMIFVVLNCLSYFHKQYCCQMSVKKRIVYNFKCFEAVACGR